MTYNKNRVTFLFEPLLIFNAMLLHMALFLTKKSKLHFFHLTLIVLMFPFILRSIHPFLSYSLIMNDHISTFKPIILHPFLSLHTHGQKIHTWTIFLCKIRDLERPILKWKWVKDKINQEWLRYLNF